MSTELLSFAHFLYNYISVLCASSLSNVTSAKKACSLLHPSRNRYFVNKYFDELKVICPSPLQRNKQESLEIEAIKAQDLVSSIISLVITL